MSSIFFEAQKYYFVFESRLTFHFFEMVIFTTLFQCCPTLSKSTLKMTTFFGRCLTLFKSTLKQTTLIRLGSILCGSMLFYVVNFNVDIHNLVSTLIWRCAISRRHINLKTALERRWNVFWEPYLMIKTPIRSWSTQACRRGLF